MVKENNLTTHFYGINAPYHEYLLKMHELHDMVARKEIDAHLMLLEHEPVITLTRQYLHKNVISSEDAIKNNGIACHIADRGGDATFHGPGQLVGYLLLRLEPVDLSSYIRTLEKSLLHACHELGIKNAESKAGFTGVWVSSKKLIAIGVGVKNATTKHGFALNIDIDHSRYLKHIVPCGLSDFGVTSLKEVFDKEHLEMPDFSAIVEVITKNIAKAFNLSLSKGSL